MIAEAGLRKGVRDNTVNGSIAGGLTFCRFYLLPRAHSTSGCCRLSFRARVLAGDVAGSPTLHSKWQGQLFQCKWHWNQYKLNLHWCGCPVLTSGVEESQGTGYRMGIHTCSWGNKN